MSKFWLVLEPHSQFVINANFMHFATTGSAVPGSSDRYFYDPAPHNLLCHFPISMSFIHMQKEEKLEGSQSNPFTVS